MTTPEPLPALDELVTYTVTTLGAALAAAAVAVVAFSGFLMTTFCAAAADGVVPFESSVSSATPAPAPPPMRAPATRPAIPIRSLLCRRFGSEAGAAGSMAAGNDPVGGSPPPGGADADHAGAP